MELSPAQQRLLFAVVVIALVGLGVFLIRAHDQSAAATPATTPTTAASASAPASAGATAIGPPAAASSAPASSPGAASSPSTGGTAAGGADIYQWLPFTQSDLAAAAKTTMSFATVYANTSYTETQAAYAGKLAGLTTPAEATTLESDFETPGVKTARTAGKQVATGTPTINSIASFGAGPPEPSITFNVTIAQRLSSTTGTMSSTPEYAITTVSTVNGWQVQNIQLSSVGN